MFHDLEILNKKRYRFELRIKDELFSFRWEEPSIHEMLKIAEQLNFDPDASQLEYHVQSSLAIFNFLHKVDQKFSHDHFKEITPEKATEAIEKIMEPLYGDKEEQEASRRKKPIKSSINRFMRQMMFLMRQSKGAFTHESILNLTFSQFFAYTKALAYTIRGETKEGQNQNYIDDKKEEIRNTKKEDIDEIRKKVAEQKKGWEHLIHRPNA